MMKFQRPKGTKDILPKDIGKWHFVEKTIHDIMSLYNFSEIRTPAFEHTELFTRGVGSETDIVGKEMYTFIDKGGNSITLKPEMTAPVARAYVENGLQTEAPHQKLYYISSMFRYENPQEGRFREHSQFGGEILGTDDIYSDIEIIMLAKEVYNRCGIDNFKVKINSIGKLNARKKYIDLLKTYLQQHKSDLSDDSKHRLERNPLRILDSKDKKDNEIVNNAPKILDHLETESKIRFEKVINGLEKLGVDFEVDFRLVRGLDYYTDTTFEFVSHNLGSQDALGGGGRYDGLVETIGGKPAPGIGFGSGIERVILAAERNNFNFPALTSLKIYMIALSDEAKGIALKLCSDLRKMGISCDSGLSEKSLKAQMRNANRQNSELVYIIGETEIQTGKGILKKMSDGSQTEIPFGELKENIS
jgi:histidyl-tRNA synthetase